MKFHLSDIHLSESEEEDCPYVLLQNSFEFSRGPAYFECHDLDLVGDGHVKRFELRPALLEIDITDSAEHTLPSHSMILNEKIGNIASC